ncbi:hypothetical protein CDCA_CDCA10G3079 [Cyanidium caldarium]|uniref:Trefoil factor n=1 Tax=Cyanidium caldarium TaxID=2771 RepID=A0AAV9IXN9_CYACA|nr:hypothetical protein CDCA_CDCA10G3079 [Cyanidium caldarium]
MGGGKRLRAHFLIAAALLLVALAAAPTFSLAATASPSATASATSSATTTATATATPTVSITATATVSITATPTVSITATPTPICTNITCGSAGQYTNEQQCQQVGCCWNSNDNICTLRTVSNLCSAVSDNNRVACGWAYIYPDECTSIPGCCWQPTPNNVIAPWCFYDAAHAPQASAAAQEVQAPVPVCPPPNQQRTPCGHSGINRFTCYSQGCCYDAQAQSQWVQSGQSSQQFQQSPYCYQAEKTCSVPQFERQQCQLQNSNQPSVFTTQQCLQAGCCVGYGGECYQKQAEYTCQPYGYVSDSTSGATNTSSEYIPCGPECCNQLTQNCTYTPQNNNQNSQDLSNSFPQQSFCVCKDPSKQCGTYLIPSDNLVNKVRCCKDDETCVNDVCVAST